MSTVDSPALATFRVRRLWLFASVVVTVLPVWLLAGGAITLVTGRVPSLGSILGVPLAGGLGAVLVAGRRLGWVRVSAAGLEFAQNRHRPAFLPWSAIQSVRLRYRGPFTQLVVTPTDPGAISVAPTQGRPPHLGRWRGAYLVDVGMMTPRPPTLLAELNRRLAEQP